MEITKVLKWEDFIVKLQIRHSTILSEL